MDNVRIDVNQLNTLLEKGCLHLSGNQLLFSSKNEERKLETYNFLKDIPDLEKYLVPKFFSTNVQDNVQCGAINFSAIQTTNLSTNGNICICSDDVDNIYSDDDIKKKHGKDNIGRWEYINGKEMDTTLPKIYTIMYDHAPAIQQEIFELSALFDKNKTNILCDVPFFQVSLQDNTTPQIIIGDLDDIIYPNNPRNNLIKKFSEANNAPLSNQHHLKIALATLLYQSYIKKNSKKDLQSFKNEFKEKFPEL